LWPLICSSGIFADLNLNSCNLPQFSIPFNLMRRRVCFPILTFACTALVLPGCLCLFTQSASSQVYRPLGPQSTDHLPQKYKVEGTVINSLTGEPVPRALVQLNGSSMETALTGLDGRFHFEAVPEGPIAVTARKPGFFEKDAGKPRTWSRSSITVGPQTESITVMLVPEGVIYGHVEDANGEPIENAQIRVLQVRIQEGRKRRQQVSGTQTDEEGDFRIADLAQGTYYIGVEANSSLLRNPIEQSKKNREGYPAVVYYPTSTDLSYAQPVNLSPGKKIQLQFSLKQEPLFHLSGKVTGMPSGTYANLQFFDLAGIPLTFTPQFDPQSGTFKTIVPAGTYVLRATAPDVNRHEMLAEQMITVDSDLPDLRLSLAPSVSLPVIVRTEITKETHDHLDVANPQGYRQEVNVQFSPIDPANRAAWANVDPGDPSSFKVGNIVPGKYSVAVSPLRGDRYVQSAKCGTVDLLREELVVPPGVQLPPIEIVLRDDSAMLTGKVLNVNADYFTNLLVVPQFAPAQPSQIMNVYGPNEFQTPGLAPGDYKIFAFDSLDQVEYASPEVLSHYASQAATVTLSANGKSNVTVDLIRTGE
jgi:hypothetical protein